MMNEIVILSGKGGTGKTSLIACFTMLAEGSLVIADCDVDGPDLHFLLKPQVQEKHEFLASKMASMASIDLELCSRCGLCSEHCRFEAIADNFTSTLWPVRAVDCARTSVLSARSPWRMSFLDTGFALLPGVGPWFTRVSALVRLTRGNWSAK